MNPQDQQGQNNNTGPIIENNTPSLEPTQPPSQPQQAPLPTTQSTDPTQPGYTPPPMQAQPQQSPADPMAPPPQQQQPVQPPSQAVQPPASVPVAGVQQPGTAAVGQSQNSGPILPEKKKSKAPLIIGLVLGGLVLIGVGIAALFMVGMNLINQSTEESEAVSAAFIQAIAAEEYDEAYGYFSPELKEVQSQQDFELQVRSLMLDESCNLNVTNRQIAGESGASAQVQLDGRVACDGQSYSASFVYLLDDMANPRMMSYSIQ
jgi:hypothetical protein